MRGTVVEERSCHLVAFIPARFFPNRLLLRPAQALARPDRYPHTHPVTRQLPPTPSQAPTQSWRCACCTACASLALCLPCRPASPWGSARTLSARQPTGSRSARTTRCRPGCACCAIALCIGCHKLLWWAALDASTACHTLSAMLCLHAPQLLLRPAICSLRPPIRSLLPFIAALDLCSDLPRPTPSSRTQRPALTRMRGGAACWLRCCCP